MWKVLWDIFVGGSWQTSLFGFLGAVVAILLPIVQTRMPTQQEWLFAVFSVVAGRLAKFTNATGGTQVTGPIQPSQMAEDNKTAIAGFKKCSDTDGNRHL